MTHHSANHDSPPSPDAAVAKLRQYLLDNSPIYSLILSDITLAKISRGTVTLQLRLSRTHLNSKGALHGAVSATIVDFVTGLAICSHDLREQTGASVDMHLSFLSTAKEGDTAVIHSTAEKVGGNMAFVTVRINKLGEDGTERPVTLAQHTKYVRGTGPPVDRK
ncbi:hypothetical protein QQS21_000536 [Conoideocrella luteorostrata]|uniref:Thioesterase domain-containing protein n=1 Tax=Conoideocrella luteorostrata TaxID=1105319 RepID=A0AAJ0CYN3_9HYPO|nr:hypothetical protein QQS21_000536 [Conoideocrella luteorostrata]